MISGPQTFFYKTFPDGKIVKSCDLVTRKIVVEDPKTKKTIENNFDYASEGAIVMGVAAAPDGTLAGGSAFPMHFFALDPKTEKIVNRPAYGQWNTITRRGDHFFVGAYPGGWVLDWNPAKPWVPTVKDNPESNPRYITGCDPTIHRPTCLFAYPDGKTMILGGTPEYGYTGGGLFFWNTETDQRTLLTDKELIPDQSTQSLVALPEGKLIGGTTTEPGTGGEKKAKEAELYLMDFASRKSSGTRRSFPACSNTPSFTPARPTRSTASRIESFFSSSIRASDRSSTSAMSSPTWASAPASRARGSLSIRRTTRPTSCS